MSPTAMGITFLLIGATSWLVGDHIGHHPGGWGAILKLIGVCLAFEAMIALIIITAMR